MPRKAFVNFNLKGRKFFELFLLFKSSEKRTEGSLGLNDFENLIEDLNELIGIKIQNVENEFKKITKRDPEFIFPEEFIQRYLPMLMKKTPADNSERTKLKRKTMDDV